MMSRHNQLPILYQDLDIVVINKPSGLLVHRSAIDRCATEFALQMVRDQIGQHVYPVHRLDRPTSGALIFALSPSAARHFTDAFASGGVRKTYLAVVRGIPPQHGTVDYPLKEKLDEKSDMMARTDKPAQSAVTDFKTLAHCEFPVAVDKYPTTRYALVQAQPRTGRKHQIRRHLHHIGHPLIGDVNYGSGKHNRFFADRFQNRRLLLACTDLHFPHPTAPFETVHVRAPLAPEFMNLLRELNWSEHAQ